MKNWDDIRIEFEQKFLDPIDPSTAEIATQWLVTSIQEANWTWTNLNDWTHKFICGLATEYTVNFPGMVMSPERLWQVLMHRKWDMLPENIRGIFIALMRDCMIKYNDVMVKQAMSLV